MEELSESCNDFVSGSVCSIQAASHHNYMVLKFHIQKFPLFGGGVVFDGLKLMFIVFIFCMLSLCCFETVCTFKYGK